MVARILQLWRLPPAADLDGVVLRLTLRHVWVRWVGQRFQRGVAIDLGCRQLLLRLAQLFFDLLQLLDLLRSRLALELLPRPEVVDSGHQLAPALVGGEPGVERVGSSLAREGGPVSVGVVARGLRVDQAGCRATTASGSGTRRGRRSASAAAWRTCWASRFDSRAARSCPG